MVVELPFSAHENPKNKGYVKGLPKCTSFNDVVCVQTDEEVSIR